MRMSMKKQVGILLLLVSITTILFIFTSKDETPGYLKEQQNIDINDTEKRNEYLKDFESKPSFVNDTEVNQWEGGFKTIDIEGFHLLLEDNLIENLDRFIEVEERIRAGFEMLEDLNKDIKTGDLENYYQKNKKTLSNIYGHTEERDFIDFSETLEFFPKDKAIEKAIIYKATRIGNIIELKTLIKTDEETGEVTILCIYSEKEKTYLIVWR